jgi:hypothetical protein
VGVGLGFGLESTGAGNGVAYAFPYKSPLQPKFAPASIAQPTSDGGDGDTSSKTLKTVLWTPLMSCFAEAPICVHVPDWVKLPYASTPFPGLVKFPAIPAVNKPRKPSFARG